VTWKPEPAGTGGGELCVLLGLGAILCAIPSRSVTRLLLLEEARLLNAGVLQVDASKFAVWDLAQLLGFTYSAPRSWLLFSVQHEGASVPIALRAGQCLAVELVTSSLRLPHGVFRARNAAFAGAFDPARHRKLTAGVVGLQLDPLGLLSETELDLSVARLAAA